MKHGVLIAAGALVVLAGVAHFRTEKSVPTPDVPMPKPSPVMPKQPNTPTPKDGPVRGTSFEIVEGDKVKIVFAVRNGVPIAIVDDNGTARVIDLAKVARLLK